MNNKVIYLIKTFGCSACKCMEHILKDVVAEYPDIEFVVTYFSEIPDFIKLNVRLTDYPTTIFVKDDVIKYHFVGTMSAKNIKTLIKDIDF